MLIDRIENEREWLAHRTLGIGGSEAACILGMNKYKSNVQLWREKTKEYIPEDISDKLAVKYGKQAEEHIRAMFQLDFPECQITYHPYWMYHNAENSFMFATLDGEILTSDKKKGILEIKTTTIQNSAQWEEWADGKIPDSYYVQILHQLACTGFDFAILRAYIRYYDRYGNLKAKVKDERIERSEVISEIEYLIEKEKEFWDCVENKRKPNLILPSI